MDSYIKGPGEYASQHYDQIAKLLREKYLQPPSSEVDWHFDKPIDRFINGEHGQV